jgi:hypothetical protein
MYERWLISNAHSEISRKRDHVFKQMKVGSKVQARDNTEPHQQEENTNPPENHGKGNPYTYIQKIQLQ